MCIAQRHGLKPVKAQPTTTTITSAKRGVQRPSHACSASATHKHPWAFTRMHVPRARPSGSGCSIRVGIPHPFTMPRMELHPFQLSGASWERPAPFPPAPGGQQQHHSDLLAPGQSFGANLCPHGHTSHAAALSPSHAQCTCDACVRSGGVSCGSGLEDLPTMGAATTSKREGQLGRPLHRSFRARCGLRASHDTQGCLGRGDQ